jgi:hypothetical protein
VTDALAERTPSVGYPEGRYPDPRRMGQFDRLQLGAFTVVAEDQLTSRRYFGLHHTDTFVDALLMSTAGQFYLVSNAVQSDPGGSLVATPWLGAFRASPDGMVPDLRYVAWTGAATQSTRPDGRVRYSLGEGPDSEELSFSDSTLEWQDGAGRIGLSGALAGNGTQWRLPWREPDGSTGEILYSQQGYGVDGTYQGEAVSGHVVLETMWGNEHYGDSWWVKNRVGHWAFLVNNYADGTSEYGQILCGEYGARGAIIVNEQGEAVVNTTNVNASEDEVGVIRYELGNGEEWEFIAEPTRAFPEFATTRLSVGAARRVKESRQIIKANGTCITTERMPATEPFQ